MTKRAAIYVRVSADKQMVENQIAACARSRPGTVGTWSRSTRHETPY
jgi:hypothetical protein